MDRLMLIEQVMLKCTQTNQEDPPNKEAYINLDISVSKEELQRGQIQRVLKLFEMAEKKKKRGRSSITLTFDGIDRRGLIQYNSVRDFLRRLFKAKPHALYLLHKDSNLQAILLCLLEIDTGTFGNLFSKWQKGYAEFTFYGADLASHIQLYLENAIRYANRIKVASSSQRDFIVYILDAIDYEILIEDSEVL
ncbi:hypothetical protein ABER99_21715 [Paenibacillus glucanolyticus]|uniref:Uncharacterized protein n=1 Tax=Paenibacillus glucanolyticus TaxID=59843 RepID=A0A163GRC4_9BACL|nr:hypothetical protein [Paenibacillus glucanolyticus]KZS45109.1 hypothetical protein AWU65_03770 [Paenibacillus glucanolyticus]OMF63861.1 hypothetical protein BK142_32480 [Paenibacillus glucanolyticus]